MSYSARPANLSPAMTWAISCVSFTQRSYLPQISVATILLQGWTRGMALSFGKGWNSKEQAGGLSGRVGSLLAHYALTLPVGFTVPATAFGLNATEASPGVVN